MKDQEKLNELQEINYKLEWLICTISNNFEKLYEILNNVKDIDKNKEI